MSTATQRVGMSHIMQIAAGSPEVALCAAVIHDGFLSALAGNEDDIRWLMGDECRAWLEMLVAHDSVIMTAHEIHAALRQRFHEQRGSE